MWPLALFGLLSCFFQPVTMDQLLRDVQVDPKQVRWNEAEGDFE